MRAGPKGASIQPFRPGKALSPKCQQGYSWPVYEYDNDIFCRDVVDAVMKDLELQDAEQLHEFRERVEKADRSFQALALDGAHRSCRPSEWWRCVILRRAGRELADYLKAECGVAVEVVDEEAT